MLSLTLALVVSWVGFQAGFVRANGTSQLLLGYHLALVAAVTIALQLLVTPLGVGFFCCAESLWLTTLTAVHVGHALAVAHWGAMLYRSLVTYALRNARELTASFPRELSHGGAFLAATFGATALTSYMDCRANTLAPRWLGVTGALLPLAAAVVGTALFRRPRRFVRKKDPLLVVFVGLPDRDYRLPPCDPALNDALTVIAAKEPRRRATVVVFVVDSLQAGHLSFHGYHRPTAPFLASCVAERGATAVPMAVSNCASTECGLWSLLSSRRYRHLAVNGVNLHSVLRQAGYKIRFFLSGVHRGWMGLECLYGTNHDSFIDRLSDSELKTETANLPQKQPDDTEFLYYHLMSVHSVTAVPTTSELWQPSIDRVRHYQRVHTDASLIEGIVNNYDNAVAIADNCIREICAILEQKGYLQDAVVIVTADHGESVGERPGAFLGHARSLYQESIHIPLIIMDTTRRLPECTFLADQTDVAPTIADLLGIDAPGSWQGQSVHHKPFRQDAHVEFTTHRGGLPDGKRLHMDAMVSVLSSGVYKAIRYREAGRPSFQAAFCLSTDPRETQPISDDAILAVLAARRWAFLGKRTADNGL